jgi:23S rRNA (uridine2552-2'-O)-methyltransferase
MKTRVMTAKGRKNSSTKWLKRQLNDPFVKQAKKEGYRSRAAYKLLEIDEKFKILKRGQDVIDLGAAPGGWTQVALKSGCNVTAIDITEIDPIAGATIIQGDFLDNEIYEQVKRNFDVVLSDMAPPTTGHQRTNHLQIMNLVENAYAFAKEYLNEGGTFASKIFQGGGDKEFIQDLRQNFKHAKFFKPSSSRKDSSEMFIVATGFKGRVGNVDESQT